jgi:taurine dioxygenase
VGGNFQPPLVKTNIVGTKGLFFPYNYIKNIKGMTEQETDNLLKPLWDFVLQEKYCYHHDWTDGDIIISDQWLSVHKRWEFPNIEKRLLHRAVFGFPIGDYTI